jgi:hypothetical protein
MSIKSRAFALAAFMSLALAGSAAHAQSLTGAWRGIAMGIVFQLVVQPNGAYVETQSQGQLMTQQTGAIQSAGPGVVVFTVDTWSPSTMPVYHATGTVGGYYTQQPTTKPPGGTWRLVVNNANSFTLTDINLGGSITFNRVG